MRTSLSTPCCAIIALLFLAAAVTAQPGLDYFIDAGDPIDALVRGDWTAFFAGQPLMGSFSLFVRAPFVATVFHQSEPTVYWVGSLPCILALAGLALWLVRHMKRRGRSDAEQAAVGALLILSPLSVRALHWGHPEELLGAALCVACVIAGARGRGLLAGLLLGCAIATKQWAVLAFLPALVATPSHARTRLVAATALTALVFTVPLLIGNPDRFMAVQSAAASSDPQYVLSGEHGPRLPGGHVTPHNVLLPFAYAYDTARGTIYLHDEWISRVAHPLILFAALPLTLLLWRRRGAPDVRQALLLLALLFLLRCMIDPMSLDYYHVPFLTALAAAAALGGPRETRLALLAGCGLAIAFAPPATTMYELSEHAALRNVVYLAVTLPLLWSLLHALYRRPELDPRSAGAIIAPAPRAATSTR